MEHKSHNIKHGTWNTRQGEKPRPHFSTPCSMLHAPCSKGFTIVELVVTIAIFLIITSIIMVSQRRFGGNILITNLAYDMALGVRQAQTYGISVRRATQADALQQFNRSYGIHFALIGGFVLFTDINNNWRYNIDADDGVRCRLPPLGSLDLGPECVTVFKIEQGNSIAKFCGGNDCAGKDADGTPYNDIDSLDILFHRPDPEPIIKASKGDVVKSYTDASVIVTSPQGVRKTVIVSANGQISIQ